MTTSPIVVDWWVYFWLVVAPAIGAGCMAGGLLWARRARR